MRTLRSELIRRTLLIGIPLTIFILGLYALLSMAADVGHRISPETTLPKAPCALIENDETRCSTDAYVEIQAAIRDMRDSCRDWGWGVQAWAEANPQMPNGYEVLASCAGNVPQ